MTTFIAQYRGRCVECGEAIEVGDQCAYDAARRVVHAPCPETIDDRDMAREVCKVCHTVKPCFCD